MRQFYLKYKDRDDQIVQSRIGQLPDLQKSGIEQLTTDRKAWPFPLTWSHYQVLMRISNEDKRLFYVIGAAQNVWDIKSLKRQFHSSLHERLSLSTDKSKITVLTLGKRMLSTSNCSFLHAVWAELLSKMHLWAQLFL